ncbi:MAG: hypothetical protein Q8R98_03565 [Rubrivivax sp.]|nr:hypothetical protein [Rubrivivax sp.]MDP3610905.1 hypothetical protein [Rubrivivax sp.]
MKPLPRWRPLHAPAPVSAGRGLAWLLLACTVAAASACAPAPLAAGTAAAGKATSQALVGDAACTQDSECHTLPLPDQACGGPQGWLAYSSRRTQPGPLADALQREAAARPAAAVSTCGVVPDPGARCVRPASQTPGMPGRCQLAGQNPGAPTR